MPEARLGQPPTTPATTLGAGPDNPSLGKLLVRCKPACESVMVNNRSVGPSPASVALAPGEYNVRLRRSGTAPKTTSVTVVAGKTARVHAIMK